MNNAAAAAAAITFYDNHGRIEIAEMKEIVFSDGIARTICVHAHVPEAYLPKDVYQMNNDGTEWNVIGTYATTETRSTARFNAYTNLWEGTMGQPIYHFICRVPTMTLPM